MLGAWRPRGLIVGAALWMAGCGAPSASVTEYLAEGVTEFEAGHYPKAVAMFKGAAELDRERPEPSYQLGRCYLALADQKFTGGDIPAAQAYTDQAITSFDDAVAAFPGYSKALQGKVDALKLRDRHAAALAVAEWAAANSGLQAQKLIMKGREYALVGDMDRALLAHRQAVAVEPDNAATHAALGLFYMSCGNDAGAISALKRAYQLNHRAPGVASALARLGALSEVASRE